MFGVCVLALLIAPADEGSVPVADAPPAEDRFLIMELEAPEDMDPEQRILYDDLFTQALGEAAGVEVVGRRDLRALIETDMAIKSASNCTDDECLFSIAELMNVRFFFTGRFTQLETGIRFAVRAYDRQRQSVAVRRSVELTGDHTAIERACTELAEELVSGLGEAAPNWRPETSLWQRLDTTGMIGVAVFAAGIVGLGFGVVLAVMASDASSVVVALADGRSSNQHAALRARDLGWAADGALIAGASLVVVGGLMTYLGWDSEAPVVGVGVEAHGVTARVQLSF